MKGKKLTKGLIVTIIIASLAFLTAVSLIITNIFIPVKYISSYTVVVNKREEGSARVGFVDVGYGDCTVIEFPDGKTMVIDGGNGRYTAQLKLIKYLNKCGIDTIDYLVCTSVKSEHCGGLAELFKLKSVKKAYMPYCTVTQATDEYFSFCSAVKESGAQTFYCEYGEGAVGEGYSFCFLSPSVHTNEYGEYAKLNSSVTSENIENASAVMWLECNGVNFLFMSDAGSAISDKLCKSHNVGGLEMNGYKVNLADCNVLKVANHGSASSASETLNEIIRPQTAIISVGENGLNQPSLSVIASLQNYAGDNVLRTDKNGTVTLTVSGGEYSVQKEKEWN